MIKVEVVIYLSEGEAIDILDFAGYPEGRREFTPMLRRILQDRCAYELRCRLRDIYEKMKENT